MLYIFFGLLLIMLIITYIIFDDIFSPSFLMVGGYIIATFCALFNVKRWNTKVSGFALVLIIIGILSFIWVEFIVSRSFKTKENDRGKKLAEQLTSYCICLKWWKIVVAVIICLLATIYVYHEISSMGVGNTLENIAFRYKNRGKEEQLSFVSKSLIRITKAFAFSCSFVFIYCIICKRKTFYEKIMLIMPGFFWVFQSLMTGSRIKIIMFLVGISFYFFILSLYIKGERWKVDIKKIVKIILVAFCFMYLFYSAKELVGRSQEYNFIDYILTYLGGSIDLFSQYIHNPLNYRESIETLSGLVDNLQRYFGLFNNITIHTALEHRRAINGTLIGNTYTGFRNYYNDFGVVGIILFSSMLSYIFSRNYYKGKNYKKMNIRHLFSIIFYGSVLYCIPFHFFADYFFFQLAIGFVIELCTFWICIYFLFVKIKLK